MFGIAAEDYEAGRQPFPEETIEFVCNSFRAPLTRALDLGCGTGIATRQLARRCSVVIGCDPDAAMLARATSAMVANVAYCTGRAEQIPFGPNSFDLVGAFSAFHWFATRESYLEMCRVLAPCGWLAIVNKTERGKFEDTLRDVVEPYLGSRPPNAKDGYDPAALLRSFGVSELQTHSVRRDETFNFDDAMRFIRSQSLWNLVPENARAAALEAAAQWVSSEVSDHGAFVRFISVDAIVCRPGGSED